MAPDATFKIIIAGGGVAGLALANMLEKFQVDYVVLESHAEIAPQVGASIGLFPNGMRILDQIGCHDAIEALPQENLRKSYTRDPQGKVITLMDGFQDQFLHRFGYRMLFFDRQWLLRVLCDNLTHKDRVLTKKKVISVQHVGNGVHVTTQDGDVFKGSLLIGADGVHSAVRQEMLRIANEEQPGYFPSDVEDKIACYYQCSYGIAQHVPGLLPEEQHIVLGKGTAQLVCAGPEGKVYWFLFARLPSPKYGKEIPKYTKEDEAEFAEAHANLPITEKFNWGQLYEKRISSTLTPLHENLYPKWSYGRIICLGDSVHKPNPIGGQGGNGALESAAEFVNALVKMRGSLPEGLASLTQEDISNIFSSTQTARFPRARGNVKGSHKQQALASFENPLMSTIVWKVVARSSSDERTFTRIASGLVGGSKLRDLPIPKRPRACLFTDELPASPLGDRISKAVKIGFLGSMGYLAWDAWRKLPSASSPLTAGLLGTFGSPAQVLAPQLICTLESYRFGNQDSLMSVIPYIATPLIQTKAVTMVTPCYFILSALLGYGSTTGRFIKPSVALALLPALAVGYVIPKAALPLLVAKSCLQRNWAATLCQCVPFVPLLTSAFAAAFRILRCHTRGRKSLVSQVHTSHKVVTVGGKSAKVEVGDPSLDPFTTKDVPILQTVYAAVFAVQAAAHVAPIVHQTSDLKSLLTMPSSPFETLTSTGTITVGLNNMYSVWELRRLGYITTRDVVLAVLGMVAGQVLVGSGATWIGLWWWREKVLAGLRRD